MTSAEYFTSQFASFISENGHKFYDAILVTSDKYEYGVNKVVLAVRSDFFKGLFKKDGTNRSFRDKPLDKFVLPLICQQDLEPILHWIYHDEFLIDDVDAIVDVLKASEFLGLLDMSSVCQEWIVNHMEPDNALGVLIFAEDNFLEILRKKAWDFIVSHLAQVSASEEWIELRKEALEILQKESELQEIVQLVGYDALPEPEKVIMDTARSIREDYLQQSAFDEVDTYTSIQKQHKMLSTILEFGKKEADVIKKGSTSAKVGALESRGMIPKMKWTKEEELEKLLNDINSKMKQEIDTLSKESSN